MCHLHAVGSFTEPGYCCIYCRKGKLSQGQVFYKNKEETDQQFLIPEEQKIARWVYENNKSAGVGTNYFKNAKCLYLVIRIGDNVYGVIGIPWQKKRCF